MKAGRRKAKRSPAFVALRDLVPRNDPKGGATQKTVFGERPAVSEAEEKDPIHEVPAERRQKPGHGRNKRRGEVT
jgi:hypothetical protein